MSGWKSCRFIFPLDDLGTRTIKESLPNFSVKKSTISWESPYLMVCNTIALVFISILPNISEKQGKNTKNAHLAKIFYENLLDSNKSSNFAPANKQWSLRLSVRREIFIL